MVSKNLPECGSVVFSPDWELGILGDESDGIPSQLHDGIHDFDGSRDGAWVGSSRWGKAPSTEDGGGREAREHATSKWEKDIPSDLMTTFLLSMGERANVAECMCGEVEGAMMATDISQACDDVPFDGEEGRITRADKAPTSIKHSMRGGKDPKQSLGRSSDDPTIDELMAIWQYGNIAKDYDCRYASDTVGERRVGCASR